MGIYVLCTCTYLDCMWCLRIKELDCGKVFVGCGVSPWLYRWGLLESSLGSFLGSVGTLYFTKIRKYGNTEPFSVFYLAFVGTLGVIRIN